MNQGPGEWPPSKREQKSGPSLTIEDIDDAREYIKESIALGEWPMISVPVEYVDEFMKTGITHLSQLDKLSGKGYSLVAGTIGVPPLLPEDEERWLFRVNPKDIRIEPRRTGADKNFHGVIVFANGISPAALERVTEDARQPAAQTEFKRAA